VSKENIERFSADAKNNSELAEEIQAAIEQDDADGYFINRKFMFMGEWIRHCGIFGKTGSGKTTLAMRIIKELCRQKKSFKRRWFPGSGQNLPSFQRPM